MTVHPVVAAVTTRIAKRSEQTRTAYLAKIDAAADAGPARGKLGCANLAHGFAAGGTPDKEALRSFVKPNIAIVSSYNDMLSAHQPFADYPAQLKAAVRSAGGIAQFAGGVPAMCDGITQGRDGMQRRCSAGTWSRWPPGSHCRTTCSTRRSCSGCATRSCLAS